MPLGITRRPGEHFKLIWPNGDHRQIDVMLIDRHSVCLRNGAQTTVIDQMQTMIVGVPGDKSLVEISVARRNRGQSRQVSLNIDAPLSVTILRDDAKQREQSE